MATHSSILTWKIPLTEEPGRLEGSMGSGRDLTKRTSLIAQLVKNPPATQETPVQFLGREDPLENGKATHSSILA